jgi:hypothetical protein
MQKSKFGKCRWNPATSGRRCRILAKKFDRIRPDPGHFGRIFAVLAGSVQIRPDPGRFSQIRQYSGRNLVRW